MTDQPTSFVADLVVLLLDFPDRAATASERADWYSREAELLQRIATDERTSDAEELAELARFARAKAAELRRGQS